MTCCQVHGFPMQLGYVFAVSMDCFSTMWVEATLLTRSSNPTIYSAGCDLGCFGLVLRTNWADLL